MLFKIFVRVLLGTLLAFSSLASASGRGSAPTSWVPYPWAKELPFSWTNVQGVWVAGEGNMMSYFYIRIVREKNVRGGRYLSITEKDGPTCETVASGFGTEEAATRVFAEMTTTDRKVYSMMLRQYEPKSLPGAGFYSIRGKVMVLTVMNRASRKTCNYPMTKISERTEYNCVPKK
ncbi:MAG: hypothetical protein ACK5Y2_07550 [Bdellovibrionales bacterium]